MINYTLKDKDKEKALAFVAGSNQLSIKEKGMLLTLIYLEPGEDAKVDSLRKNHIADGKSAVYATLNDLKTKGYLQKDPQSGTYVHQDVKICILDKEGKNNG